MKIMMTMIQPMIIYGHDDHLMMNAFSNSDSGLQQTPGKLSWIPRGGDTNTTVLLCIPVNIQYVQQVPITYRGMYALLYAWHKP